MELDQSAIDVTNELKKKEPEKKPVELPDNFPIKLSIGPKSKGFLRRLEKLAPLQEAMSNPSNPDRAQALIQFISIYTIDPIDEQKKIEAIKDLSEEEFNLALDVISGGENAVPFQNGKPSQTT